MSERLIAQLDFLLELDKLKAILRRTRPKDFTRRENSAGSWKARSSSSRRAGTPGAAVARRGHFFCAVVSLRYPFPYPP